MIIILKRAYARKTKFNKWQKSLAKFVRWVRGWCHFIYFFQLSGCSRLCVCMFLRWEHFNFPSLYDNGYGRYIEISTIICPYKDQIQSIMVFIYRMRRYLNSQNVSKVQQSTTKLTIEFIHTQNVKTFTTIFFLSSLILCVFDWTDGACCDDEKKTWNEFQTRKIFQPENLNLKL